MRTLAPDRFFVVDGVDPVDFAPKPEPYRP